MNYNQHIDWLEPLEFASKIAQSYQDDWLFLYSGLAKNIENSISYIALFADKSQNYNSFAKIKQHITKSNHPLFGYISYEAITNCTKNTNNQPSIITFPKMQFLSFFVIIKFIHQEKKIIIHYQQEKHLNLIKNYLNNKKSLPSISLKTNSYNSNFSDYSYKKTINNIKSQIANGDFYQVNLTRKFFGELEKTYQDQDIFSNFIKLCQISPANYSSFIKIDNKYILSSSPELFLNIKNNLIKSKPIKGTISRHKNQKQDDANKKYLQNSPKERAENLMIVDLVRNDLSQICKAGSVKVDNLFNIDSYNMIHHMSSQISGIINDNNSIIDAIKATFPAGSMTGAPKIAAMQNIIDNEKINRGIYSGSIGFISQNEVNLSVVIRTLIIKDNKYEFQVGGAITYDSDPRQELAEIYSKAQALKKLLHIC